MSEWRIRRDCFREAASLIISEFPDSLAYRCTFRFALAICQRALMRDLDIVSPSLDIGVNDGSSATIANYGKAHFSYGGDMPEESTFESTGFQLEARYNVYERFVGMDAHNIPFPDASMNTIITNDMLSYGLNRDRILAEIARVLAPGGSLFLSETTANIKRYPFLLRELQKVVPSVDVLDDPVVYYRRGLKTLGMTNIEVRTGFNHRIAALTLDSLHKGAVPANIDEDKRGYHEETLRAIADMLADEFGVADTGDGWQVYARCTKPGTLDRALVVPTPICLSCHSQVITMEEDCSCTSCGAPYRSVRNVPYVLSDFSKQYSPKPTPVDSPKPIPVADALPSSPSLWQRVSRILSR